MRKLFFLFLLPLSVLFLAGLLSCSSDSWENHHHGERNDPDEELSAEKKFNIVWQAANGVDAFYEKCKSMEELESYIPEIMEIKNVEKIYIRACSIR